jgi:plasmid stabilization system protein ParE
VKRSFGFHPEARGELRAAVRHYEDEAPGLGVEFAAEVRVAVDRVLDNPYAGAPGEVETRRKLLRRFPYLLIYLVESEKEHIHIIALMHHRRRPGYWHERLQG